ncbi:MAG: phosphate transporter, partial [Cutibacterium acnes]
VGAGTSAVARAGTLGVIVDLGLLTVMAALIVRQANQHNVDHRNVNDSTQVGVRKGSAVAGGTAA